MYRLLVALVLIGCTEQQPESHECVRNRLQHQIAVVKENIVRHQQEHARLCKEANETQNAEERTGLMVEAECWATGTDYQVQLLADTIARLDAHEQGKPLPPIRLELAK